ncbi:dockerin type I repeat-containing protein [Bacteroides sp.]|uniref:dockerin type I repeat-containing protein n=1 Tax=Bacteroides sp. TaxID=29523 RepID=UPI0025C60733|nr:dockerin type I repeat-containing protein [Bacteroides sp.]
MKKNLFVLCLLLCTTTLVRAQFSGNGAGTANDPYQITNADELFEVRNDLLASYKLMNDIDLKQWIEEDNPTQGWSPIGNEDTPFQGTFDGNNKVIKGLYINRSSSDNIGLFGYIKTSVINDVALLSPIISGSNNVGGVVGKCGYNSSADIIDNMNTIKNVIIIRGDISGKENVGGVVGTIEPSDYNFQYGKTPVFPMSIVGCYASSIITSSGVNTGGICGKICSGQYYYYYSSYSSGAGATYQVLLDDNVFAGIMNAKSVAGGIVGWSVGYSLNSDFLKSCYNIERNLVTGTIKSSGSNVCGIIGQYTERYKEKERTVKYNVNIADSMFVLSTAYRIADELWPNNFAYSGTKVFVNGKPVTVEDNNYNGTAYGLKTLKKQSTYEGMGFDFSNQWAIVEGQTFPYNKRQSAPPTVTSFTAGSKGSISGTATRNGSVYVMVGNNVYESYILDNKWTVTLGAISQGMTVKVAARCDGSMPSILVTAVATSGSGETPDVLKGDANGDSSVDTADVVAIVNHILGKSSVSFVEVNADLNGDGQVSVDDAVATVQLILDKQ